MTDSIRVLHADKSETFRNLMTLVLQDAGDIELLSAVASPQQLLAEAERLQPDVIVLDVWMPLSATIELCNQLHQCFPAIRKMVYSFHVDPHTVRHLLTTEIDGYLGRNASAQEIIGSIRAVHRGGTAFSHHCRPFIGHRSKRIDLSETELEVLRLLCREWSTEQIANHLHKSEGTITTYRQSLRNKSGASTPLGLAIFAIANGLLSWDEVAEALKATWK